MSDVITLKHRFVKEGKLSKSDLKNIWSSYPPKIHDILLELLQKFEILFKTKIFDSLQEVEKEVLLIPSLLPPDQPQNFNEIWKEFTKEKKGDWFDSNETKQDLFFFRENLHFPVFASWIFQQNDGQNFVYGESQSYLFLSIWHYN
eukprot:TRINITY_DN17317_c0_g1_i1.p1 TRINITY_DN17317_c0_g1~~TRINITY_DN17317_c0_g1_i1.p1  ORF type:complete len:146 (+),score=39.87 TRINITY_DN17317_c0_g1_i1:122-559(+)